MHPLRAGITHRAAPLTFITPARPAARESGCARLRFVVKQAVRHWQSAEAHASPHVPALPCPELRRDRKPAEADGAPRA
jgi:hypothetical protein